MPFTSYATQFMLLYYLKEKILNATKHVELLDETMAVVKSFTLTSDDISVYGSDSETIMKIRILDNSSDAYNFKYVRVYFRPGVEDLVAIHHELSQTYSKSASQSLELYIYTGIAGVVSV